MSSTYRILCLSHNPAIELDPEWNAPGEAVAVATDPAALDALAAHTGCDLLVGRFSYPLIEVCCPPMNVRGIAGSSHLAGVYHSHEKWIDLDWLRLLDAARELRDNVDSGIDPFPPVLTKFERSCWTPARLRRLREYLTERS